MSENENPKPEQPAGDAGAQTGANVETGAPAPQAAPAQAPSYSAPAPDASSAQQAPSSAPVPPQPTPAAQPCYPQQPAMPAPLTALSGGMKFGWFVIGALVGIPGIILAWLVNVDKLPQVKNDAVKFSVIGFAVWVVLGVLACIGFLGMVAAAVGSIGYNYSYSSVW